MGKRSTIPTTDAGAASLTVSGSNQQTAFAKHQSWPMVKPVLLAALVCAAPGCLSSAQDATVSVDMMGIGSMSCAHWQSTQAHRSEGTGLDLWFLLNSIRGDAPPLTPGTPLVHFGSEGYPKHRPPRKTNPEGQQVARIGLRGTNPFTFD